jgi:hypothetical protein
MSDELKKLLEKWQKEASTFRAGDRYRQGLEMCADELEAALSAQPKWVRSRSQVQVIGWPAPKTWDDFKKGALATYGGGYHEERDLKIFQHGMSTIFNLLRAEFLESSALLAQPAPTTIVVDYDAMPKQEYDALLRDEYSAKGPAEPASDSPDNYCFYGVPIASDECELCPPGTHKSLDSAGGNLRAVHVGREHTASPGPAPSQPPVNFADVSPPKLIVLAPAANESQAPTSESTCEPGPVKEGMQSGPPATEPEFDRLKAQKDAIVAKQQEAHDAKVRKEALLWAADFMEADLTPEEDAEWMKTEVGIEYFKARKLRELSKKGG